MKTKESFERVRTTRGLKWRLPNRDTSDLKFFGWILVAVAGVGTLFMFSWIAGPFTIGVGMLVAKQPMGWIPIAFSMLGLIGLRFSLRLLILGFKVLRGTTHSEVEIAGGYLVAREKIGWFDWRRKVKLDEIHSLQITEKAVQTSGSKRSLSKRGKTATSSLPFDLPDMKCLMVENEEGKQTAIALLHSPELLEALAHDISAAIEPLRSGSTSSAIAVASLLASPNDQTEPGAIPVHVDDPDILSSPTRPASCRIVEHEEADGTIGWEVPAIGFRGGARFLLVFGMIWTGLSGFMLIQVLSDLLANPFDWEKVFATVVVGAFILVGVAILISSYVWATSHVMIGAVDGQFLIERSSNLRTKSIDFPVDSIVYIEVCDGNMEVNHEPIRELKVVLQNGEQHGLLGGHNETELDWFAFRLNEQLDLKFPANGPFWRKELGCHDNEQLSQLRLPSESRVVVSQDKEFRVSIPPHGLVKMLPMLITSVTLAPIPLLIYFFAINEIILIVFGIVFLLLAIGINVCMLMYYFRAFDIETDGVDLAVTRRGLLGHETFKWQRETIRSIDLSDSGTKVNGKTLHQLLIDGVPKLTLMTGWDKQEIAVVAGLLNQAFGLISDDEDSMTETT